VKQAANGGSSTRHQHHHQGHDKGGETIDLSNLPSGDICTLCGDGGLILLCDGPCHRSFHMECVGLKIEPSDAKWLCPDCTAGKHMCLCCGKVGKMGSETGVSQCSMAKCGRFYHASCVLHHPKVEWVGKKRFRCPSHFCHKCKNGANSHVRSHKKQSPGAATTATTLPIVSCTHCPRAYHEKCLRGMRILRLSSTLMICSDHLEAGKGVVVDAGDSSSIDSGSSSEDEEEIVMDEENDEEDGDDERPLKKQKGSKQKSSKAPLSQTTTKRNRDNDSSSGRPRRMVKRTKKLASSSSSSSFGL
jgi:hypothetical protein